MGKGKGKLSGKEKGMNMERSKASIRPKINGYLIKVAHYEVNEEKGG